jgi:hypothetical protein
MLFWLIGLQIRTSEIGEAAHAGKFSFQYLKMREMLTK